MLVRGGEIYILVCPSVTHPHLPPQVDPLPDGDIYLDIGRCQGTRPAPGRPGVGGGRGWVELEGEDLRNIGVAVTS